MLEQEKVPRRPLLTRRNNKVTLYTPPRLLLEEKLSAKLTDEVYKDMIYKKVG